MLVDYRENTVEYGPAAWVGSESVERPAAVGETLHQAAGGEKAQMTGDARLALVHDLAQFHDREFFLGQECDDPQPRRLAGGAQDFDPLLQTNRHKDIRMSLCSSVKLSA